MRWLNRVLCVSEYPIGCIRQLRAFRQCEKNAKEKKTEKIKNIRFVIFFITFFHFGKAFSKEEKLHFFFF